MLGYLAKSLDFIAIDIHLSDVVCVTYSVCAYMCTQAHINTQHTYKVQCEQYWARKIFTIQSTPHSHIAPQNHLSPCSPLLENAGKKHYELLKEKPRQGLGGKGKRKGSFKKVKHPTKYVPRIKSSISAIFGER